LRGPTDIKPARGELNRTRVNAPEDIIVTRFEGFSQGSPAWLLLGLAPASFGLSAVLDPPWSWSVPILSMLAATGIAALLLVRDARRAWRQRARFEHVSLAGYGRVEDVRETSIRLNKKPVFEIGMQVELPDRKPYRVKHTSVVPLLRLSRLEPGRLLPLRIDPDDPANMQVDWS